MNSLTVAIDNGYSGLKAVNSQDYLNYPINMKSKFKEYDSYPVTSPKTHLVEFEGKKYVVGDGLFNIELDKTNNILHKLTTYTTLGLLNQRFNVNVFNLAVMYPLLNYNAKNNEAFKQYLKAPEPIEIKVNGKLSRFSINNFIVLPQTATAIYIDVNQYKNEIVSLVDIGGYTCQGCIFNKLTLVKESIYSKSLGMIMLYEKIKKKLNSQFNIVLQDYEIPSIYDNPLYKEFVDEVVFAHLEEIKQNMQLANWNLNLLKLKFIGGGSIELKSYIEKVFPNAIVTETIYDNALGALKVAEYQK